jgi:hypothetical protein
MMLTDQVVRFSKGNEVLKQQVALTYVDDCGDAIFGLLLFYS